MAVIVVGRRQPRSKRVRCSSCGVELEYLAADLLEKDGFLFVVCPVRKCKHETYLGTVNGSGSNNRNANC